MQVEKLKATKMGNALLSEKKRKCNCSNPKHGKRLKIIFFLPTNFKLTMQRSFLDIPFLAMQPLLSPICSLSIFSVSLKYSMAVRSTTSIKGKSCQRTTCRSTSSSPNECAKTIYMEIINIFQNQRIKSIYFHVIFDDIF